jgi:hypothetical protein
LGFDQITRLQLHSTPLHYCHSPSHRTGFSFRLSTMAYILLLCIYVCMCVCMYVCMYVCMFCMSPLALSQIRHYSLSIADVLKATGFRDTISQIYSYQRLRPWYPCKSTFWATHGAVARRPSHLNLGHLHSPAIHFSYTCHWRHSAEITTDADFPDEKIRLVDVDRTWNPGMSVITRKESLQMPV